MPQPSFELDYRKVVLAVAVAVAALGSATLFFKSSPADQPATASQEAPRDEIVVPPMPVISDAHQARMAEYDRIRAAQEARERVAPKAPVTISEAEMSMPKLTMPTSGLVSAQAPGAANTKCSFDFRALPENTKVFGVDGSNGGTKLPFQIDDSGDFARQIDVVVHADTPAVLVLSSYNPRVWNIKWSENTQVLAVMAAGYHRQVVAGLPAGVPVISDCKGLTDTYKADRLQNASVETFNRNIVSTVQSSTSKESVVSNSARPMTNVWTSSDTPVESFWDKSRPLAGKAGIAQAVEQELIRPASPVDLWPVQKRAAAEYCAVNGCKAPQTQQELAGQELPNLSGIYGEVYVVLKDFTYPAALYGGYAVAFIIPENVAMPKGDPGHSSVYAVNPKYKLCSSPICQ